jgi:hypothetical protein
MGTACSPTIYAQPGIYSIEQFHAALEREKARAERNGHSVSLATIQTEGCPGRERLRLEDVLRGRLRIMDEAGWFDSSQIGVLMPYTSPQGAWRMIEDMCRLMHGELSFSDCRVYTYPRDWFDGHGEMPPQERAVAGERQHVGSASESLVDAACGQGDFAETVDALQSPHPFGSRARIAPPIWQRALDVFGSLTGLVVLSPLLLATALVIKVVSPGPVFFRQVRIGRGGKPFSLWSSER